jgi:hypothetical protein
MDSSTIQVLFAIVGASISFCWGIWTWRTARKDKLSADERDQERYAQTRKVEATRPFLEKQLALYAEAARVCAQLASPNPDPKAASRFWELYWGELALVENRDVEAAMVSFGNTLHFAPEDRSELQQRALKLAMACRLSLAQSWGVEAWVTPDLASVRPNPSLERTRTGMALGPRGSQV